MVGRLVDGEALADADAGAVVPAAAARLRLHGHELLQLLPRSRMSSRRRRRVAETVGRSGGTICMIGHALLGS